MSETTPPLPGPLFFPRVITLDREIHAGLRLDRRAGFGFAATTQAIPLAIAEIPLAARHFPIIFAVGDKPMPLAVTGYREGENLFVETNGSWHAGTYMPAWLRAYPFILIEPPQGGDDYLIGMAEAAASLSDTEGEPLFMAEQQPSPVLRDAITLCQSLREGLANTENMVLALLAEGLLEPQEARLEFNGGGVARLDGFQVINPARLQALSDSTVLEWHRNGWLSTAYAALHSAASWGNLMDIATRRRNQQH